MTANRPSLPKAVARSGGLTDVLRMADNLEVWPQFLSKPEQELASFAPKALHKLWGLPVMATRIIPIQGPVVALHPSSQGMTGSLGDR